MKYVTIAMLCAHAKKHRSSVLRALRAAGLTPQRLPGCKGLRLPEPEATDFLARQWPQAGPLFPSTSMPIPTGTDPSTPPVL